MRLANKALHGKQGGVCITAPLAISGDYHSSPLQVTTVVLTGLKSQPELNGRRGKGRVRPKKGGSGNILGVSFDLTPGRPQDLQKVQFGALMLRTEKFGNFSLSPFGANAPKSRGLHF